MSACQTSKSLLVLSSCWFLNSRKVAVLSDMLFISGVFAERVQRYRALLSGLLKVQKSGFLFFCILFYILHL